MKIRIFAIMNLLILIFGLSFIQNNVNKNFGSMNSSWSKNDLKLIDPIDSVTQDSCDILAVFMRKNIYELEIRVDFLNENDIENCTLETKFFASMQNEIIYKISSDMEHQSNPGPNSVILNREYQYILLRFPLNYSKYKVQFASRKKNNFSTSDFTQQINLLQPSPKPFQISLMAFNSHPGFMPSQILRSWDGAHTGPNGQRHGLKFLLEAAESSQIPITLLDLNTPSGLAAIEFLDKSEKIKSLQSSSIIFLPVSVNIDPQYSQLFINSFLKNSASHGYANQNTVFYNLNQKFLVNYDDNGKFIDLTKEYYLDFNSNPKENYDPFSINGLSERTIKKIFTENGNPLNTINILFPVNESIVADQKYAKKIILSIKNHPWLEVVYPFQIFTNSKPTGFLPISDSKQHIAVLQNEVINQIIISEGPFQNYLFNYANDINGRIESNQFHELSNQYLPNIYYYFAANQWAKNFSENNSCDFDIDNDGMNECVLSNRHYFGIIELDGGRLAFLVIHSDDLVYQLVAPSSSIMYGLGPEQEWNFENSQFADPQEIPGAFYIKDLKNDNYRVLSVQDNMLSIFGNNTSKKFFIDDEGFKLEFYGTENIPLLVPIILTPDCMQANQWLKEYKISWNEADSRFSIKCLSETASVIFSGPVSASITSFIESQRFMLLPENPEISYSDGHYFKIGLTLLKLNYLEPQRLIVTITR